MILQAAGIIFRKELTDLLRDKRTLIVGILIPIVIFPLVFGFMNFNQKRNNLTLANNLNIGLAGNSENLQAFLAKQSTLHLLPTAAPQDELRQGRFFAALILADDFDRRLAEGNPAEVKILFDSSEQLSIKAGAQLASLLTAFEQGVVKARWVAHGLEPALLKPLAVQQETVETKSGGVSLMLLSLMLPLLLMVYSATSPLAAAVDLGAGEKERETMEPLLTTPVRRLDLLLGKFLAITVIGVMGVMAFMIGFFISYQMSPELFAGGKLPLLRPMPVIGIALLTVVLTMIFGAIELALSIYAKSSKEAQTFLAPLTVISLAAGYSPFMLDIKNIALPYFHVPLVNISLVIKELVLGIYAPLHISLTLLWAVVYIALAFLFAGWMFSREEVIFRS